MKEPAGAPPPRSVSRKQILTDGVIVVVHCDARTQHVFREGKTGLLVALLKPALVPDVIALRLICREKTETRGKIQQLIKLKSQTN